MRSFLLSVAALLIAACHTYTSEIEGSAGEGYEDLTDVQTLYVLPVELPREIHGEVTYAEMQTFRRDWPENGARLVANGVNENAEGINAMFHKSKPDSGYYFELEVTYIDYGSAEIPVRLANFDRETKTQVRAQGRIVNAQTEEVIATFSFTQGTAYGVEHPFEMDMLNVGRELGDWLDDQREQPRTHKPEA